MSDSKHSSPRSGKGQHDSSSNSPPLQAAPEKNSPEVDPAADRGERIATGKAIARGGKEHGFVPGADPDPAGS